MTLTTTSPLPTLYEYYTAGGVNSGLNADKPYFTLNDKNVTLYSGAMHYYRIPRKYWRDRLKKLRAAGLNTVETYVPWNLHEPENGVYDFGKGGSDYQSFLDVEEYLKMAQEEDLFAIVRAGPYICSEWEMGGFPSWLLREEGLKIFRTTSSVYMKFVKRFFSILLPILAALQFTKGGPIIAFQVENEYGFATNIHLEYMQQLVTIFQENGLVELLVSSDATRSGTRGTLPDVLLQTLNFDSDPVTNFDKLKEMQPDRPLMAMEVYPAWFDYWSGSHTTLSNDTFYNLYEGILAYPASVNLYMFHGGTNWGFLNGAAFSGLDNSNYRPVTTSYDFDAPLSEAGDYTDKYYIMKNLIKQYNPIKALTPEPPELVPRTAYPSVAIEGMFTYGDIIDRAPALYLSESTLSMEQLPINNASGQSYGYVVYRKEKLNIPADSVLNITGHIRDSVIIMINGQMISKPPTSSEDLDGFGFWRLKTSEIILTSTDLTSATLDIIIKNWGRGNSNHMETEFKGLVSDNQVLLNGEEITSWIIYPYEFKKWWTQNLEGWRSVDVNDLKTGPAMYKATLTLEDDPTDTFINMENWNIGIVIVNGFNLRKYALFGPQQTLYLPGPFLQNGDNEIIIFEEFVPSTEIKFSADPVYKTL